MTQKSTRPALGDKHPASARHTLAGWYSRCDGQGPPLVLVHGVGLDHRMYDPVLQQLTRANTVVRYDLWGHGRSDDPPGPRTLEDFITQLLEVIEHHRLSIPHIAGLSLGGLIVRAAATRYPQHFARVGILNAVYQRTEAQRQGARERLARTEHEGMQPVAALAIDRWFSQAWQAQHPEKVAMVYEQLLSNDVKAYLKAYRVFIEGDARPGPGCGPGLSAITCPTLLMTGQLDVGSTAQMSRAMAGEIPDAQLRILPGLRHLPPIEAPEMFADALLEFLNPETPL